MSGDKKQLERMVDLLRTGAAMLPEHCPECGSPLFRIRDEIWCPKCNKRVIIVREGEAVAKATSPVLLDAIEETILTKLRDVNQQIKNEKDPVRLQRLGDLLFTWIGTLEKLRRIRRT